VELNANRYIEVLYVRFIVGDGVDVVGDVMHCLSLVNTVVNI
jgi:hypothetical protein